MKSKEKVMEEVVLIRYYNVFFYLFLKAGIDDLVNRIGAGEVHEG